MDGDRARPQFAVVVRGYDRHQVDDYVARLLEYLDEAEQRARAAEQTSGAPAPHTAAAAGVGRAEVTALTSSSIGDHIVRPVVDSVVLLLLSLSAALLLVYVVLA
jgi:DivIVA domain-containing protein